MRRNDASSNSSSSSHPSPPSPTLVPRGGRRVSPVADGELEKNLPNGDVYRGGFAGGAPHGRGAYVWSDGCVYNGEWRRGKAHGKGKFSWPSGAVFEGEFRRGRMEGNGVFLAPDGSSYSGEWLADRRHGRGVKLYANGDVYDGLWRRGVPDGRGRYSWRSSGNVYIGEWRSGLISGRGTLLWENGNRYDGIWENGIPKGVGFFSYPDGTRCVGSWGNAGADFYPSVTETGRRKNYLSVDHEKVYPKICIWESDGGDITCDIVDWLEASTMKLNSSIPQGLQSPWKEAVGKRQGEIIVRGHKNYELMLNLQLGIRYTVGKSAAMPTRELRESDFDPKEKYWTRFPPTGSKVTPPHSSTEFWWKDYCPLVFRHLRKLFAVDPADYMMAICGDDALRELSSPGKSGSFFYLTQDDRFMIKTVKKSEMKVLIRMLSGYYQHVSQYENSLLTKFYGVHSLKPIGGQKVRFIVMGNLFCSEYRIHRRFDLKGSSYGRTADKDGEEIDETTTLKDLDLNFVFLLKKYWHNKFVEQISKDCDFLESEGIMDYSLLVGIHFHDNISALTIPGYGASPKLSGKVTFHADGGFSAHALSRQNFDEIITARTPSVSLGVNLPAQVQQISRLSELDTLHFNAGEAIQKSEQCGNIHDVILFFGIIDILQDYDFVKKLEHAYKSFQVDPNSISSVDPKFYSKRFQGFVGKIFIEER